MSWLQRGACPVETQHAQRGDNSRTSTFQHPTCLTKVFISSLPLFCLQLKKRRGGGGVKRSKEAKETMKNTLYTRKYMQLNSSMGKSCKTASVYVSKKSVMELSQPPLLHAVSLLKNAVCKVKLFLLLPERKPCDSFLSVLCLFSWRNFNLFCCIEHQGSNICQVDTPHSKDSWFFLLLSKYVY